LQKYRSVFDAGVSAEQLKAFMNELGVAGEDYRESVYSGFSGEKSTLDKSELVRFIEMALQYFNHSIAANRRPDGLFHSYNLVHFGQDGCEVENLYEMLEGQVAVLSSGYLAPQESLALLNSLRASKIYRSDQNSYMLYPYRKLARFLDRNVIARSIIEGNSWINKELESGRGNFVEQDIDGAVHFNAGFRNVGELSAALGRREEVSREDAIALCNVYEAVFRHRQFTGRSGCMFKYEGLGCIYWHMVSKLLLATAEVIDGASQRNADKTTINQLHVRFTEIKEGVGVHKTPAEYGAFPTDPYSHTPGFTGVQQPGMTGQVKEDIITRFFELGVKVSEGQIEFAPAILRRDEFIAEPETWNYSVGGTEQCEELEAGSLAFSLCAVPVIYRLAKEYAIRVVEDDGRHEVISGNRLDRARSRSIFRRDGRVQKIVVDIPDIELS
jgi:hypothetical protein